MEAPQRYHLEPVIKEKKIPYLFPHEGIFTKKDSRYLFTSYPRYIDEIKIIIKYLTKTRGIKKIGILHADNSYGYLFRDKLNESSNRMNYVVTRIQSVKHMLPDDLKSEMLLLKNSGPDAIIMALYPAQAQKCLEAKAEIDWTTVTMVSSGPLTDEQYLNVQEGSGEGIIGLCYYPDPNKSREKGIIEFRESMEKYYPGTLLNRCYVSVPISNLVSQFLS